jgi:hypothetical protein
MTLSHGDRADRESAEHHNNSSILDTSMLNSSVDMSQPRIFQG